MDIGPYVESLRRDLLAAAESAGEQAREVAERLGYALDPAVRLAVMEAISQAAAEITAAMPSGGVDVRLDGRDLDFVVTPGEPNGPVGPAAPELVTGPVPAEPPAEDEGQARVSLRLPESLKARADEAAAQAGQSLNTWLVTLIRSATSERALPVDVDLSSRPFGADFPFGGQPGGKPGADRRLTGWL
ncbi:toxin-antitoxin system HicB family antitoxin [Nocardioides nitrophenolicus]|uniref:toxin-antitoxin system HicB family antitoxin n=1 Tax=Nocardioides nitrophenolicus TaxID=60489 RepID=UPI00195B4DAE|nr:toxin-antitoxin system HicB family antitoxin [Nocardioides nitrophenolicus]MBM7516834.1 antitoxin component of RelBE/YafQ-DinJ toxin-antitoxin module [Nocardioides nitrophenolicus]